MGEEPKPTPATQTNRYKTNKENAAERKWHKEKHTTNDDSKVLQEEKNIEYDNDYSSS